MAGRPLIDVLADVPTLLDVPIKDDLARELRTAAQKTDEWRRRRDQAICRASDAGASYREIAAEVGLTHVAVMKIRRKSQP